MGPAELLDDDLSKIRGVILEEGGKTSHVAIVARHPQFPRGQVAGIIDSVDTGSLIIIDGSTGEVFARLISTWNNRCREGGGSTRASRRSTRTCAM